MCVCFFYDFDIYKSRSNLHNVAIVFIIQDLSTSRYNRMAIKWIITSESLYCVDYKLVMIFFKCASFVYFFLVFSFVLMNLFEKYKLFIIIEYITFYASVRSTERIYSSEDIWFCLPAESTDLHGRSLYKFFLPVACSRYIS